MPAMSCCRPPCDSCKMNFESWRVSPPRLREWYCLEVVDFGGTERFQVVRRLGSGGMGVVYEAIDREHETRVALKTLRTWTADSFLRFKAEFRALQDLHHPNLVSLGEL